MKSYRTILTQAAGKLLLAYLGLILFSTLTAALSASSAEPPPATVPSAPSALSQIPSTSTVPVSAPTEASRASRTALSESASTDPLNILLIGQDHREGEPGARSDTMILCTFQPQTGQLTMTSFLRDLYLPIPGHGSNRINAAYAFGGASLLQKTLEKNFDISIQGTVEVDFGQFAGIVDALGGVELSLRQDEAALISMETGSTLQEGPQLLNGQQALSYARIRRLDSDGDFSRTDRQRRVLQAIWDSCRSCSTGTALRLLRKIIPMITTDMSTTQLLGFAKDILPKLSSLQVESLRIPADGHYTHKRISGMAVLEADMDAAKKLLKQITAPPPQEE